MLGLLTAGLAIYSMVEADKQNKEADKRASKANAANKAAAEEARRRAEEDATARKAELLRRFNISGSKIDDSRQQINMATSVELTSLDMSLLEARSKTDNTLASRHITGRLAARLKNAADIKGDMAKGSITQKAVTQNKEISAKLETLAMDLETQQLDLDIDLDNAITAANNNEVRGYVDSSSRGTAGVVAGGLQGIQMGMSLTNSFNNYRSTQAANVPSGAIGTAVLQGRR